MTQNQAKRYKAQVRRRYRNGEYDSLPGGSEQWRDAVLAAIDANTDDEPEPIASPATRRRLNTLGKAASEFMSNA